MHPHLIKLLSLSALTAGILAASAGVRADEVKAPSFSAEPCCNLCPEAHDAKNDGFGHGCYEAHESYEKKMGKEEKEEHHE